MAEGAGPALFARARLHKASFLLQVEERPKSAGKPLRERSGTIRMSKELPGNSLRGAGSCPEADAHLDFCRWSLLQVVEAVAVECGQDASLLPGASWPHCHALLLDSAEVRGPLLVPSFLEHAGLGPPCLHTLLWLSAGPIPGPSLHWAEQPRAIDSVPLSPDQMED